MSYPKHIFQHNKNYLSLASCTVGEQPNSNGTGCEPCPRGSYKTEEAAAGNGWRDSCSTCPADRPFTDATGSTTLEMCGGFMF